MRESPDKARQRTARWQEENREAYNAKQRRYAARNRHKVRARARVRTALDNGTLVRPSACDQCGGGGEIQAHHEDYDRPLAVEWLCRACHAVR